MPKIMGKRIVLITREEYELLACGWCRPADVPKRKGTADMVRRARKVGVTVREIGRTQAAR